MASTPTPDANGRVRPPSIVYVEDEIESLRLNEDLQYAKNRAQLGQSSLALVNEYLDLYIHLWQIATDQMPRDPIQHANIFTHQMLIECRADLIRTMILLLRTHLIEAHGQTRRAIECCAWAKRISDVPILVQEWLSIDFDKAPSRQWRDNVKSSLLFPESNLTLLALRGRYQATSRCVHPFRFSFDGRMQVVSNPDETVNIGYSFFDPEENRLLIPTRFLWTLQTHDLIFDVFEEIYAREIEVQHAEWEERRAAVRNSLKRVGNHWIEVTKRVEERKARSVGSSV